MSLQQLFTSRKPYDANAFVGQLGKIFYDEATGQMRLGDGVTPGGNPIPFTIASSSTVGGLKLGPGVTLNPQNQLIVDTAGLDFAFGDFYAFTNLGPSDGACLSSVNTDQDVNIVSNGTGTVNVVGVFNVHKTDSTVEGALSVNPIFKVSNDGQITILVPVSDSTAGAVKIVGSQSGLFSSPINTGVMLHITGNNNAASRIYNDSIGSFAAFVARRLNGSVTTSTAVLANEEIMRISGTAHNGTIIPGTANQRIVYRALGNQTPTNQGGAIEFWTTPQNTTTLTQIATIDNINGITSTKFTGPVVGNVTGNVSATAVTATNVVVGNTIRYDVTQNNSTATQTVSKATTVVCNGRTGQITLSNSSIAKGEAITFTVTNSAVTAVTDVPVIAFQTGATSNSYAATVTRVQVGSFNVTIVNNGTGPLTDTIVLNFALIKVS